MPFAAALLALLAQTPSSEDVEMTVTHAFNRVLAPGWQPYLVTLKNRTQRDLVLTLKADHPSAEIAVTRRVTLAAGALQRHFLYVWPVYGEEIVYRLLGPDGRLAATPQKHAVDWRGWNRDVGILFLSRRPAGGSLLGLPQNLMIGGGSVDTTQGFSAPPERVPDHPAGLEKLKAIVLHDYPIESLSPDQRRALRDYVAGGGLMVIVPGSDPGWLRDPFIQELAPVKVERDFALTSLRERRLLGSTHRIDPPGVAFELGGGSPAGSLGAMEAFRRFRSGFGEVLVAATDLNRYGLPEWRGTSLAWGEAFASVHGSGTTALPFFTEDAEAPLLRWISSNLRRTPPILLLLGLTLAYTAAIGPLHLLLLRRLKRPLWALATIPAIAGAFVAAVVVVGIVLRGTSTVGQQLNLIQSYTGAGVAREKAFFALHSPADRRYDVEAPAEFWMEPAMAMGRRTYYGAMEQFETGFTMEQGGGRTLLRDLPVGQWQTRFFVGRRFIDAGKGIFFRWDESELIVQNGSGRTIRSAALLLGGDEGSSLPVGPIGPGQEARVGSERLIEGFDPVAALGVDRKQLEGRLLEAWSRDQHRGTLRGLRPMLVCRMEPADEPVKTDASRREAGALWFVFEEPEP